MPIILRRRVFFPMMQSDGSLLNVEKATIAFIGSDGSQVSQVNIDASEVEGIADGAALRFVEGEPHGLTIPDETGEMILPEVIQ